MSEDRTITKSEVDAAIEATQVVPGPTVNIDYRDGETWVVIGEGEQRRLIHDDDQPLAHTPRVFMHADGCHVSIGFDDTQDTILTVTEHPAEAYGDIARAREWVAAVRGALGQEPQDA